MSGTEMRDGNALCECGKALGQHFGPKFRCDKGGYGSMPTFRPAAPVVPAPTPEQYGPLVDVPYTGEQETTFLRLYRERETRGRHKATLLALADEAIRLRAHASSSSAIREAAESLDSAAANVLLAFHDWPVYESMAVVKERGDALNVLAERISEWRAALSSSGASPERAP